jgi:hypothetical protein
VKISLEREDFDELMQFSKFLGYTLALDKFTSYLTNAQRVQIAYSAIFGEESK